MEESRKKLEDTGKTLEKLLEGPKLYSKKYDDELKEVEICRQKLEEAKQNWEKSRLDWEKSGQKMEEFYKIIERHRKRYTFAK